MIKIKIKDYKCKCRNNDWFFAKKGSQIGIYCNWCGNWLKWADKDEQNLAMKQESVLDKIRTEIEQRPYGVANDSVIQGIKYERIDILKILDKYKAEMEK